MVVVNLTILLEIFFNSGLVSEFPCAHEFRLRRSELYWKQLFIRAYLSIISYYSNNY